RSLSRHIKLLKHIAERTPSTLDATLRTFDHLFFPAGFVKAEKRQNCLDGLIPEPPRSGLFQKWQRWPEAMRFQVSDHHTARPQQASERRIRSSGRSPQCPPRAFETREQTSRECTGPSDSLPSIPHQCA